MTKKKKLFHVKKRLFLFEVYYTALYLIYLSFIPRFFIKLTNEAKKYFDIQIFREVGCWAYRDGSKGHQIEYVEQIFTDEVIYQANSMKPNSKKHFPEKAEINICRDKNKFQVRCLITAQKYFWSFSSNLKLSAFSFLFKSNGYW